MIARGETLDTNFRLKVVQQGVVREMQFRELLTRRTVVSVHMKNNTGSCDRQNESLARHTADFDRLGYNLVALSRDTCGAHGRYAAAKDIGFILASDPKDAFAHAARSMVQKTMYGRSFTGPARAAFVLETDGTVLAVVEKIDPSQHAETLLALIKSL